MKKILRIVLASVFVVTALIALTGAPSGAVESDSPVSPTAPAAAVEPVAPTPAAGPASPETAKVSSDDASKSDEADPLRIAFTAEHGTIIPGKRVTCDRGVTVTFRDYSVSADSLDADLETNNAVFRGNVVLNSKDTRAAGEQLSLNMKTKEWRFTAADTILSPAAMKGQATDQAYLHGAEITSEKGIYSLTGGSFTTCDKEDPDYCFRAKDIEVYPGSRIVAHKVSLFALGKLLFSLPKMLIPIRQMSRNLIPQIGSSASEGMYLKAAYAYNATATSQGFLKLDVMQKRGVGAGVEQTYKTSLGSGLLSLYYLQDQETGGANVTGSVQHKQKLGTVDLDLSTDYRTNSYQYYYNTTSLNWRAALRHLTAKTNSELTIRDERTESSGVYNTLTTSFTHRQQYSSRLSSILSLDMRAYDSEYSSSSSEQKDLNTSFQLTDHADKYDLTLNACKRFDMGSTDSYFSSGLDKLPELMLETDSTRLHGLNLLFGLPYRLSLSAGRYYESTSDAEENRLFLELMMMDKLLRLSRRTDLNVSAGFQQSIYAADMARYDLKLDTQLTSRFGEYMKGRLSYEYERPEGYSPFEFDYVGENNYSRFVLDYQKEKRLKWSLSTGYDFDRSNKEPWQDVALRLTSYPSSFWSYSLSTGFDPDDSTLRNLVAQVKIDLPKRLGLDMGVRYNMEDGKLNLVRGRMALQVNPIWRVEAITSWNGLSNTFDYNAFRLTRDMHCMEMSLTYNSESGGSLGSGISLEMRIKAFPTEDRFGIGQYGQAMNSSMGVDY